MGYYTRYTLQIIDGPATEDVEGDCPTCGQSHTKSVPILDLMARENECVGHEDSMKWYDHKEDMIAFSRRWPDTVFQLNGEGEDVGDVWVKFFKGGKVQESRAVITLDKFDEGMLQ